MGGEMGCWRMIDTLMLVILREWSLIFPLFLEVVDVRYTNFKEVASSYFQLANILSCESQNPSQC